MEHTKGEHTHTNIQVTVEIISGKFTAVIRYGINNTHHFPSHCETKFCYPPPPNNGYLT